jgi:hypothetical protein
MPLHLLGERREERNIKDAHRLDSPAPKKVGKFCRAEVNRPLTMPAQLLTPRILHNQGAILGDN